tara:strand:- start:1860 stop:3671 length:1812 start_codon:yes stop_codon:yes gene_type:complete
MPGGTLQIYKLGAQDLYLYGNPQLTYFKSVYKRHTNFAMEMIRFDFEGKRELANDVNVNFRCKIPRNGDLINKLYFVINLPDIYSGYDVYVDDNNVTHEINYNFQWIPSIGTQMITKCTLIIGGNKISELYGQWIEIWHELFLDTAGKNNFDYMVGNVPDVFLPANNGWNAGKYPSSSLSPEYNVDPISANWYTSEFKSNPFLQPPSIKARKLYVPLPFWFCTNPGLSLPLIALQYHDVHLEFEMRPITQLYTIIETRDPKNLRQRTVPLSTNSYHHIGNFITSKPPESFSNFTNLGDGELNIQGWDMDAHILGNYIFLDNEERNLFAKNSHEYLIEQVFRKEFTGIEGTQQLNLDFNHPVKYLAWFGQRDDISTRLNAHNNYTNWLDANIPPESDAYLELLGVENRDFLYFSQIENYDVSLYTIDTITGEVYDGNGDIADSQKYILLDTSGTQIIQGKLIPLDEDSSGNRALLPTKFNFEYYNQDVIKSSRLLFDGNERYSSQNSDFFKFLQSYQHNFKIDKPGIFLYSFSLDPTKYQPSGACNLSRQSNVQLEIETSLIKPLTPIGQNFNYQPYQYNIYIYAVNYNILRIMSGMAGTAFSN